MNTASQNYAKAFFLQAALTARVSGAAQSNLFVETMPPAIYVGIRNTIDDVMSGVRHINEVVLDWFTLPGRQGRFVPSPGHSVTVRKQCALLETFLYESLDSLGTPDIKPQDYHNKPIEYFGEQIAAARLGWADWQHMSIEFERGALGKAWAYPVLIEHAVLRSGEVAGRIRMAHPDFRYDP